MFVLTNLSRFFSACVIEKNEPQFDKLTFSKICMLDIYLLSVTKAKSASVNKIAYQFLKSQRW